MKINIEYTEEEYKALVGLGERMFDSVDNAVNRSTKLSMARIKNSFKQAIMSAISDDDDFEDTDSEEDSSDSFNPDFSLIEGGKPTEIVKGPFASKSKDTDESSALEMSAYAERGKEAFYDLIELWLINFCVEGAEQPPRAEKCEELTQSYDGRAIIHYMAFLRKKYPNGGLTYAVRDTGLVENEQIRLVAENLTAVASACRFTQLASYLEHPNPTSQEDFFNV